jgi:hypothetical protein
MKHGRILFPLVLFALVPCLLRAQYLEPGDIDVFIEGQENFVNEMSENVKITDMISWLSFANRMKKLGDDFTQLFEGRMSEREFTNLQKTYQRFVDAERGIPEGFSQGIGKMGFQSNGHQKYWTIMFGAMCFDKAEGAGTTAETWGRVENLIDSRDLAIIKNRIEDLKNM